MNMQEFCNTYGITCKAIRINSRPDGLCDGVTRDFQVTLTRIDKHETTHELTTYFSQGSAWETDPTAAEVIDSLAVDSRSYLESKNPLYFCREFGYTYWEFGKRVFNGCKQNSGKLYRFLGRKLRNYLLYEVEPL